jgi:hypothetical protein
MRHVILSWYAYAESGAATGRATHWMERDSNVALDRFEAGDASVSERRVGMGTLESEMSGSGRHDLPGSHGLEALIDLARCDRTAGKLAGH